MTDDTASTRPMDVPLDSERSPLVHKYTAALAARSANQAKALGLSEKEQMVAFFIILCGLAERLGGENFIVNAFADQWPDLFDDNAEEDEDGRVEVIHDEPKIALLRRCLPYLQAALADLEVNFEATDEGYQDVVELVTLITAIKTVALPDPKNDG